MWSSFWPSPCHHCAEFQRSHTLNNLANMAWSFILRDSAPVCERYVDFPESGEDFFSSWRKYRDLQQSLASSSTDVEPHGEIVSKNSSAGAFIRSCKLSPQSGRNLRFVMWFKVFGTLVQVTSKIRGVRWWLSFWIGFRTSLVLILTLPLANSGILGNSYNLSEFQRLQWG